MKFKTKYIILPMLLITAVLAAACSKTEDTPSIGESDFSPALTSYSGYFLQTESANFFVADSDSSMFSKNDFVRIYPANGAESEISFDGLKTGDKIEIDITLVQTLYPPVAPIYGLRFLESGEASNIDQDVISRLEELGWHTAAIETESGVSPTATGSTYSGYFLQTESEDSFISDKFFVADSDSNMFSKNDFVKIYPAGDAEDEVSLDGLKTGDRIEIDIIIV